MATTPIEILDCTVIRVYTVANSKSVTKGFAVKFSGADTAIENMAGTTDDCIGIALDTGAAGAQVRVAHWGCGIAVAKVGTGGATRGATAKYASDGLTDRTEGGGTTKVTSLGTFMQSGSAGDYVGVLLNGCPGVGS